VPCADQRPACVARIQIWPAPRRVAASGLRRGERPGDGVAARIRLGDRERNAGENAGVITGRDAPRAPHLTRRTATSHTLMSLDAEWRGLPEPVAPAGR
jgi:hypothetical protein